MTRIEIPLADGQMAALEELARKRNTTPAGLLQEEVIKLLRSVDPGEWEERKRRALAAAGRFNSGCPDLARRHDDYLTEPDDDAEARIA
jgi:hypothetical protein